MQTKSTPRILIVDDFKEVSEILRDILSLLGDFQVTTASSGKEFLERVPEVAPDLVFVDIAMPGIDGLEVCRIMKSNETSSHIPIILLTAVSRERTKKDGIFREYGIFDTLQKPFTLHEVEYVIQRFLKHFR